MVFWGSHKIGLSHRVTTVPWPAGKALGMGQGRWSQDGDPMGLIRWVQVWPYRRSARTMGEELLEAQEALFA